jgi:hypothetical protein
MIVDKYNRKVEGYWFSKHSPEYPMPTPYELTQIEADAIADLIKVKQRSATKNIYRGFATSRIDHTSVGSSEYSLDGWHWPESLAEHYVRKYKVKPSNEFLEFLGYTA